VAEINDGVTEFMNEPWQNTSDQPAGAQASGDAAAAHEPLPPNDAAAAEMTAPDLSADDDDGVGPPPIPEIEYAPGHEPKGIAVADADDDRPIKMEWYILKVQSNREDSIKDSLKRNVERAGLEKYFAEIIVPIETVTEFKGGKRKVIKRKLYPGYLVVRMEINDDTWYLVRETAGIGDFTGSIGRPSPMAPQDIAKILSKTEEKPEEAPRLNIRVKKGDRVKINEGTFENFEGEVDTINEASGRVSVIINIFGRPTPVELEHWQIEAL
jgi:transcriptional antiterminator NusG